VPDGQGGPASIRVYVPRESFVLFQMVLFPSPSPSTSTSTSRSISFPWSASGRGGGGGESFLCHMHPPRCCFFKTSPPCTIPHQSLVRPTLVLSILRRIGSRLFRVGGAIFFCLNWPSLNGRCFSVWLSFFLLPREHRCVSCLAQLPWPLLPTLAEPFSYSSSHMLAECFLLRFWKHRFLLTNHSNKPF
jgi:hypothetical protein